ncbi:23S rRNA (adenine(2030)-N(6))-methyltransferase RlmJ [Neiella marina]|uniref:23S rRNA (Adenine(2030)-N(6))-methyltransferase RlmJ n=1 Tax=Neiella holothuriorum TaxID=2870530 RepID=A0ABS7EIM0_9GAMM|nr:23S rRNA (adenine(2030)-N(6))-methyltransferase RlmJ [Neiella holothuriorum]MBW8192181.1 23S rRNA (adenine(2030)-N(6))-methyltransferase RlmJ [Neiella holothuriorum]
MVYEHKTKAGNLGDVFKHLALVQMLEGLLTHHQGKHFCYADTYAGRPDYAVTSSKGWRKGAGKLLSIDVPPMPAARFWHQHVANVPESAEMARYPGSTLLADQLIALHGFKSQMMLWETTGANMSALRERFPHAKYTAQAEAKASDLLLEQADFIFVDPPGVHSRRHPDYPNWQTLAQMLVLPSAMLMWLPLPDSLTSSRTITHREIRQLAVSLNFTVSEVVWNTSGMLGCQLLYRADPAVMAATRNIIDWMAGVISCEARHFDVSGA